MALDPAPCSPWRTLSSREVYRNPWSVLLEDRLAGPDGRPGMYGYFAERDAVLVLPLFADGTTILVRQWRHAYGCSSWELPCGAVEPGESAQDAAERELAEEAGVRADRWRALGSFHPSDARVAGRTSCYVAEGLESAESPGDASEFDLVRARLPLAEAIAAVDQGRITHVASMYLLLRIARELHQPPPAR
ncbi:MAG: NUDIX hydrolase [Planctomycetes bacterium]|nr:NUDIX hydrolase [Planctomycetota bacterium]